MKILVIAYPDLSDNDLALIQDYRKANDPHFYKIVYPHFTLVFPVPDFSLPDFINEIKQQIAGTETIEFAIRCSTINKDDFNDTCHCFLVPDEGYSEIAKLHDKLYSGKLSGHLRLDLDFIPHITVGNSIDMAACKKMVDEWNENNFEIKGKITSVDIVKYENETVTTMEKITLDP